MNSYCWNSKDDTGLNDYCTTATASKGAGGWYSYTSGTTHYCCTANKTNASTATAKNNGSNYTITYQGHSNGDTTTMKCCVHATSAPTTYGNSRCWDSLSTYCTTGTGSSGKGGYYQYANSSGSQICCKSDATADSETVYLTSETGTTLYTKNQDYSKTCCHNLDGTNYWYNTSSETGGSCCSSESNKACCESSQNSHDRGWYRNSTCCHNHLSSDNCCKAIDGEDHWLSSDRTTCCSDENSSAACCVSNNNPNGTGRHYINGKCWASMDSYCTTGTASSGAGGYNSHDGTNCCTVNKDNGSTITATSSSGNYTITFRGHSNGATTTNTCCVTSSSAPKTYGNGICWTNLSTYCTTGTGSSGKGGYHQYANSSGSQICCKSNATADSETTYVGSSSGTTLYLKNQDYSKTCCTNLNNSYYYSTSDETGGTCCTSENDSSTCCTSSQNPNGAGDWSGSSCTHCTGWEVGSTCCTDESTDTCCEASNNPNGAGKLVSRVDNPSIPYCCHDETYSDSCCKKFKGDSYSLSGGVCKEPETPEWNLAVQYGTCYWVGANGVNPYPSTDITTYVDGSASMSASAYGPNVVFDYWEKVSGTCYISDTSSASTTVSISGSNTCTVKAHCKKQKQNCTISITGTKKVSCNNGNCTISGNRVNTNSQFCSWTVYSSDPVPGTGGYCFQSTYGWTSGTSGGWGNNDEITYNMTNTSPCNITLRACPNSGYENDYECVTTTYSISTTGGVSCNCTPYYCSKACCEADGGKWKGGSGPSACMLQ